MKKARVLYMRRDGHAFGCSALRPAKKRAGCCMKLHLDKKAFRVLLNNIHERTGYRADVLEKDYYVVLVLEELAGKQRNVR